MAEWECRAYQWKQLLNRCHRVGKILGLNFSVWTGNVFVEHYFALLSEICMFFVFLTMNFLSLNDNHKVGFMVPRVWRSWTQSGILLVVSHFIFIFVCSLRSTERESSSFEVIWTNSHFKIDIISLCFGELSITLNFLKILFWITLVSDTFCH